MYRKWHYLKPNQDSETIHQCVWYDCETDPVVEPDGHTRHDLRFGWAAYRRRIRGGSWSEPQWYRFTDWIDLWSWVRDKVRARVKLYVWAHNQGFDLLASHALEGLALMGGEMTTAIVDAPPVIIEYEFDGRKLSLVDTLNIWRMSLKKMGALTGLEKLDMPKEWTGAAQDDEYCKRDVSIIMQAVCEWADFLVDQDLGKFCLTVASQAMQTFRHRYLKDKILIDCDEWALEVSRAAYRGGRVEAFFIGERKEPLYLLDVNSLYPYVMSKGEYPLRWAGSYEGATVGELRHMLQRYLVCARVVVETRQPCVPEGGKGKMIFPVGRFETCLATPELRYLLEHERIVEVKGVAAYTKGRPFTGFVRDLYGRRVRAARAGNKVGSEHYKLLLNSFSGKWGQNGIKWVTLERTDERAIKFMRSIHYQTDEVTEYRQFNGLIQRRETEPESPQSHPAIAAHITSEGRMVLWALIRQIPPKHCLYCDTDSILVTEDGFKHVEHLIADEILGGLKLVGHYSHARVYGLKDYELDGVRTLKGIRHDAVEFKPGRYRQDKWVGFKGALRDGRLDAPRMVGLVKSLRRAYDKGIVGPDGFVLPFHRDGGGAGAAGNTGSDGNTLPAGG